MSSSLDAIKPGLYARALSDDFQAELALAHRAWQPEEEDWTDFIDMLAMSWVDAEGHTLLERELGGIRLPQHRGWHIGQRAGVFVIDECTHGLLQARDAQTEETLQLQVATELLPGTVILGRLLSVGEGTWAPTGQPDVFESLTVIQRMELVRAWLENPRAALLSAQDGLRSSFLFQWEQRIAFLHFFGVDLVVFSDLTEAAVRLDAFFQYLLGEYRAPSLGGQTYLDEFEAERHDKPSEHRLELDQSLQGCSNLGVVYDEIEGIHFLPNYGVFKAQVEGTTSGFDLVAAYLEDPGISALPFRRTDSLSALRQHTGRDQASLEELLDELKPGPSRRAPSLLPGPGE